MKWLVIAVVVAAASYLAWGSLFPTVTVRYRLTIEALVDERPVSGSGIIEVTRSDTTAIGSMGGTGFSITGEAIAVDLAHKGQFFVLLRGREIGLPEDKSFPPYIILEAFSRQLDKRANPVEQMRMLNKLHPKADLPIALLPMLIRFRDINDPRSVEKLDPNTLESAFGPSVHWRGATIEIVRDPPTGGISQRLAWFQDWEKRGGALDGTRFPDTNRLSANIGILAFKRRGV